nr:MAG TPA: hypothetical protein [Caudoviricetes sp.]
MELVSYCVHDFNLSKLCGVGLAVVVSLSHIPKKGPKRGKYRKGRVIHYNASISNHLKIRGMARVEAFLFDETNSLRG